MELFKRSLIVLSSIAVFLIFTISCVQAGPKEEEFISEVLGIIEKNYIYPSDPSSCRYQIENYLASRGPIELEGGPSLEGESVCFDKYSELLTPWEYKALQEEMSGHFGGIGAIIGPGEKGGVKVIEPLEGSPALKSGMKA
mgnify:FL=1